MELLVVDKDEYHKVVDGAYNVFNGALFNDVNSKKADEVYYFLFKEGKYRLGLVVGLKNSTILSPFSAPFGGFSYLRDDVRINHIEGALEALESWAASNKINEIKFVLPPLIYHHTFISKQINVFFRSNYQVANIDLNYYLECGLTGDAYKRQLWNSARKSLNRALVSDLVFWKCTSEREKNLAYSVIEKNRRWKGFSLKMSYHDIVKTNDVIEKDFFLVCDKAEAVIASAIVYHVADGVVQVVYWGDMPGYSLQRPMNFLSYMIFNHYNSLDVKYIDVGPSTEGSVPNYGLCEFKESVGCKIVPKYTFVKKVNGDLKHG